MREALRRRMRPEVGLAVEIELPGMLDDLVRSLADGGCLAHAVDDLRCRVVHPAALDAAEEWQEIRFFVRACEARTGVAATVTPARSPAPAADYGPTARRIGFSISPRS